MRHLKVFEIYHQLDKDIIKEFFQDIIDEFDILKIKPGVFTEDNKYYIYYNLYNSTCDKDGYIASTGDTKELPCIVLEIFKGWDSLPGRRFAKFSKDFVDFKKDIRNDGYEIFKPDTYDRVDFFTKRVYSIIKL